MKQTSCKEAVAFHFKGMIQKKFLWSSCTNLVLHMHVLGQQGGLFWRTFGSHKTTKMAHCILYIATLNNISKWIIDGVTTVTMLVLLFIAFLNFARPLRILEG